MSGNQETKNQISKCPFHNSSKGKQSIISTQNKDWWPNALDVSILRQNGVESNPLPERYNYREAFLSLDLNEVKADLHELMTQSQDWWPADFGHYGPLFVRMAWHSAGTYRVTDGRGGGSTGSQRFAPLNSWPDNANLDKARLLLWPIKQKYGRKISWADLMILAGNCALESMGLKTYGFAGGREDVWQPESDINWGSEKKWLGDKRYSEDRDLDNPLAAVQMGLIYVNPEGPNGVPDPLKAAIDIRETFKRMAMNDYETVALIAGGHTFGKAHGASTPENNVGKEPEAAEIEHMGMGWISSYRKGNAEDTITSGIEGTWTSTPSKWSNDFFKNLFKYEWELTKSPAGAFQWQPKNFDEIDRVPDAHVKDLYHKPFMLTTDLSLKYDPEYLKISKRFLENPDEFAEAFAKAWYKLTHRDLGPHSRFLGAEVPSEQLIWQDPLPQESKSQLSKKDILTLKQMISASSLASKDLMYTAWSAASTYRDSDKRGGANGARIQLLPQREWKVNMPKELNTVLNELNKVKLNFDTSNPDGMKVSMADLIVFGGQIGLEQILKESEVSTEIEFHSGRVDATQEDTDIESMNVLYPIADGFRNFCLPQLNNEAERLLIDKAQLLTLSIPEMVALIGGFRTINLNYNHSSLGILTDKPGRISNDFFRNILDMEILWRPDEDSDGYFIGFDRKSRIQKWRASRVDLIFASNSELRAMSEYYGSNDGEQQLITDFVKAWQKVMNLDRFDLK